VSQNDVGPKPEWRYVIFLLIVFAVILKAGDANADIFDDADSALKQVDTVLRAVKQPVGHVANANALAVSLQTDLLGEDNVQATANIRKATGVISPFSNYRDTLATTTRSIALFWRQLTH
jgi:hypothetical protein